MLVNLATQNQPYFTGTTHTSSSSSWDSTHSSTSTSQKSGTVDTDTNTVTTYETVYEPNPLMKWLRKKLNRGELD